MKLPIPFEFAGSVVSEVEIKRPTAGVLADTQRIADGGKSYAAVSTLLAGCIVGEETPRTLVAAMPYRSAEYLALHAVLLISPDDGFEGVYKCPRCGCQVVSEMTEGEDDRDFVSDLEVVHLEEPGTILFKLSEPVALKSKGEEVERVEEIEMRHPTMGDCEQAEKRTGGKDTMRTQFALYAKSLVAVDGAAVNDQWKNAVGDLVFDRMDAADIGRLGDEVSRFGMKRRVEKHCPDCGKAWRAEVNTSGFFESALPSD